MRVHHVRHPFPATGELWQVPGKVVGQSFGVATTKPQAINLVRLEEDLSAYHLRLSQVVIENLPWQECVRRYDREATFFLLDPPYWKTEGYRTADFQLTDYVSLAETLAALRGRAILTINDHPDMRRIFAGRFRIEEATVGESLPNAAAAKRKRRKELLVYSWRRAA